MYTSIKGIYENGLLTFSKPAPNIEKSEVLVTFLNEDKPKKKRVPRILKRLGELQGDSIPDDFNALLDDLKYYM